LGLADSGSGRQCDELLPFGRQAGPLYRRLNPDVPHRLGHLRVQQPVDGALEVGELPANPFEFPAFLAGGPDTPTLLVAGQSQHAEVLLGYAEVGERTADLLVGAVLLA